MPNLPARSLCPREIAMCPSSEVCTDYARNLIRIKAKQVVRGRGFNRSELPDIEQELFFHLIKQAPNFDPKRSALNTFIAKVVDSAAGMVVRARRCDKRTPEDGAEIHSLEAKFPGGTEHPKPLWAILQPEDQDRKIGKVSISDAELFERAESIQKFLDSLPDDLQKICRLLMRCSQAEAYRQLNISRRKFLLAIEEIRKRVGKLSDENF